MVRVVAILLDQGPHCVPLISAAMINLVTPVFSLVLGYFDNQDPMMTKTVVGIHIWADRR